MYRKWLFSCSRKKPCRRKIAEHSIEVKVLSKKLKLFMLLKKLEKLTAMEKMNLLYNEEGIIFFLMVDSWLIKTLVYLYKDMRVSHFWVHILRKKSRKKEVFSGEDELFCSKKNRDRRKNISFYTVVGQLFWFSKDKCVQDPLYIILFKRKIMLLDFGFFMLQCCRWKYWSFTRKQLLHVNIENMYQKVCSHHCLE